MSAEILRNHDAEIELIAGSGGIFDVEISGERVFSKFECHRFPEIGEIASLLESK